MSWSIRASRFRRVTSSLAYVPEIDGIRFFAIASVFIFHLAGDVLRHSKPDYRLSLAGNNVFAVSQCLNFGVQMFFVLSGFVLAGPFAAEYLNRGRKVDRKRFYMRRLTRLEPPYVIALILFFVLKVAGGKGQALLLLPHFGASVLYLHNLIYGRPSDINFVAWSLEIEVQFYLIAPLLALALYRIQHPGLRRMLLIAICLTSSFFATLISGPATLSLAQQLPYFVAGFLLADFFPLTSIPHARFAWDLVLLSAIPLIVLQVRSSWMLIYFAPLTLCLAYYAAFHSTWISRLLRTPIISLTGGMCYSIYLVHNYAIAATGMHTESWTSSLPFTWRLGAQALLIGPVVLAFSSLFYLLVERPCMRPDWPSYASEWLRDWALRIRKTKPPVLKAPSPMGETALPVASGEALNEIA